MALSISRDFEGGLYAVTGAQDITDTYIGAGDAFIHLRPVLTYDNRYNAYGVKVSGANGWTGDLRINTANGANPSNVNRWEAAWSYEPHGDVWNKFDTITRVDATTFTFENNEPFTQDVVYIHMAPYFSYSRWMSRFEEFKLSPYVTSGAGLSTPYVLHSLPSITEPFSGRVIGAKDIHYLRISDWSVVAPKIPIFWMHGQHCDETVGAYVYEGALDFLLSDDPMAVALRQTCVFHVLLHVNPQGLDAGYYRSSPEGGGGRDHNREWQAAEPRYSVIPVIRDLLRSIKPQGFFDFHSRQEAGSHYLYLSADRTATTTAYHERLNTRQSTSIRDSDIATSVRTFVQTDSELGPLVTPLQVTVEPSPHINQTPTTLRSFGANISKALYDMVDDGLLVVDGGLEPELPENPMLYHVERRTPPTSGTYVPHASALEVPEVEIDPGDLANADYEFRVRAENPDPETEADRYSEWSTPRVITVAVVEEETTLTAPQITSPVEDAVLSGSVLFEWTESERVVVEEPNVPPIVAVVAPTPSQELVAGNSFTLAATASDSDGSVVSVKFNINGGSDIPATYNAGTSRWEATITVPPDGAYSVTATATDDDSESTTSSAVSFTTMTPAGGDGLTLVSSGLLARFEEDSTEYPFDVNDWIGDSIHTVSLTASGRLRIQRSSSQGWFGVILDTIPERDTVFIQGDYQRFSGSTSNWCGLGAHTQDDHKTMFAGISSTRRSPELHGIEQIWDGGSGALVNTTVPSKQLTRDEPHRLSFSAKVGDFRTYDFTSENYLEGSFTGVQPLSGKVAAVINTTFMEFVSYLVMTDDHLEVTGLPSGATVEVRDAEDNVLASAVENGGTARVDMLDVNCLLAKTVAVVVDAADVDTLTPPDGVWGGDSYTFS